MLTPFTPIHLASFLWIRIYSNRGVLLLLKCIVLFVVAVSILPPSYGFVKRPINEADIQCFLTGFMKEAGVPGMAIVVFKDGDVTSKMNLGVRNANTQEPVLNETVFEAASLSKPVFAYLVFRSIDRGQYDLDKPLVEYMPIDLIEKNAPFFLPGAFYRAFLPSGRTDPAPSASFLGFAVRKSTASPLEPRI